MRCCVWSVICGYKSKLLSCNCEFYKKLNTFYKSETPNYETSNIYKILTDSYDIDICILKFDWSCMLKALNPFYPDKLWNFLLKIQICLVFPFLELFWQYRGWLFLYRSIQIGLFVVNGVVADAMSLRDKPNGNYLSSMLPV